MIIEKVFSVGATEDTMMIVWLAILFYSVGLAAILHFRPALMFHESGAWKEFGFKRSITTRYTMFPIWLFAIVWAVVSYTLAAAIVWSLALPASASASFVPVVAASALSRYSVPEEKEQDPFVGEEEVMGEEDVGEEDDLFMKPVSSVARPAYTNSLRLRPGATRIQTPARQPRQGYYVIDPATEETGIRRYVYFGEKPPGDGGGGGGDDDYVYGGGGGL